MKKPTYTLTPNRLAYLKVIVETGRAVRLFGIRNTTEYVGRVPNTRDVPVGTLHALERAGLIRITQNDWRMHIYGPTEAGIQAAAAPLPEGFIPPWEVKRQKRAQAYAEHRAKWAQEKEACDARDHLIATACAYFEQKASHDDLEAAVMRYRNAKKERAA